MPVVLAPAEVLAGLIAVCVLLCAVLIANIGKAIFSSVNFFGLLNPVVDAFDWLASHALSAMGWLWDKTNPVAVFTALVHVLHGTEQGLLGVVAGDVLNALDRIVNVAIPNAAKWAWAQAQGAILALWSTFNAFVGSVGAEFATLRGWITAYIQAVQGWVLGQIALAVRAVEGDIATVWGRTQALVSGAIAAATSSIMAVISAVRTEVLGRVITVEREIAVEIPRVEAEIGQIATVAIPTLTVAIEAVRESWETWRKDCGTPLCDGLNLLKGLEKLLEGGALFALIAEAAHDPAATAREVEAVVTAVIEAPAAAIRDLAA